MKKTHLTHWWHKHKQHMNQSCVSFSPIFPQSSNVSAFESHWPFPKATIASHWEAQVSLGWDGWSFLWHEHGDNQDQKLFVTSPIWFRQARDWTRVTEVWSRFFYNPLQFIDQYPTFMPSVHVVLFWLSLLMWLIVDVGQGAHLCWLSPKLLRENHRYMGNVPA